MKRIIEISASFSGKISTGAYENENPYYSIKETIEDGFLTDDQIKTRQEELQRFCRDQFKRDAEVSYTERIAKQYQNIRFYDGKEGRKYPSVTSIIGWDEDFYCSPEELAQYGARGTIIHKQVELFLQTGEWKDPKNIPEIYPELVILQKGSLNLSLEDINFPGFFEKYPFKVITLEDTLINHELRYGGRRDIKGIIESANPGNWKKIEGVLFDVPTILDVKSGTIDKTKHFKQLTAYAKCDAEIGQMVLIPLNNKTKQGFSEPIIETNTEKYWSLFLKDRQSFKNRYGL